MIRFTLLFLLLSFTCVAQSEEALIEGRKLFMVHCSRCHGMLGEGGSGPNLKRPYLPRATSDEQLASIISNGIEGTGMPFNWMLEGEDVENLVRYVRSLGEGTPEEITGDPVKGKELFAGSTCNSCHIVSGVGGSIGPDLTKVGLRRGTNFLAEAIIHPGKNKTMDYNGFYNFLVVKITLKDGKEMAGIRVNEDSFTIQIKDANNQFHTYYKKNIESLNKIREESLMPSFADQYTETELNNLVAYLTTLK